MRNCERIDTIILYFLLYVEGEREAKYNSFSGLYCYQGFNFKETST